MNRPELESLLKKARLPEIPEESLELFPRRVLIRLKRPTPPRPQARSKGPRFAWALGGIICLVLAFALGHRFGRLETGTGQATDSLANARLVHETLAMFPNQVRAITEDERGLNLVLSQNGDVPASTPIYVRICDGKNCASVVTFSGQEIKIAGQTLTVLSDAKGGIILTGNRLVWSSSEPIYAGNHLKIEARNLNMAAM